MKKKIFYWSPCLDRVGTIISTINSAISLSKYGKYNDVRIINVCGEWDQYRKMLKDNSVNIIDLNFKYFKILPKKGFISSRFSYMIIYLLSFFPLFFLLKKEKPDKIILHLITSLPLTLLNMFKFNTDFILRISGYPKLNIIRKFFWRISSKKINIVTCPTLDLKKDLENLDLFDRRILHYLPDAILKIGNLKKKINLPADFNTIKNKKVILSVGRLTKQKNFSYLINEFSEFLKINDNFVLFILGEGEDKKKLSQLIEDKRLKEKIFLLGFKKNIYSFMKNSQVFVLSSLWEEVGFAMIEAAMCNSYIISSDCPNGPKEFLNNGENGILFKNNSKGGLLKSLIDYSSLSKEKIFADKVILKKKTSKYSIFKHYLTLNKLLKL